MSTLRAEYVLWINVGQAGHELIGRARFAFDDQRIKLYSTCLACNVVDFSLRQKFPSVLHGDAAPRANKFGKFGVVHYLKANVHIRWALIQRLVWGIC